MPRITDVAGITVGHWTDPEAITGCTVVLPPEGTVASCEVRGGAPGTRGTDILQPGTIIEVAHAIVLTGGSSFGLATAGGVERFLEERGIGNEIGPMRVPTVPAAVIFDLGVGDPTRRPDADAGYAACVAASAVVAEGRVGVGTGATVAKLWGPERARPGGVGTWAARDGELVVGALVVANSVGEIVAEDGSILVGPTLEPGERREDLVERIGSSAAANTTLGVVATNATLPKADARRLAVAANDALDAAIHPAHTIYDGDTVFALATQEIEASFEEVAALVEPAVTTAVRRAVMPDRPPS
ncbi:MAG TPA: P1 family peptidase [Actinomycetota bacterium]|nr:P1 family peptidase [Actinomycetota bacterium]